ncbi:MAG: capsular biosynthesis protein, partial [Eubacterium sp.]|nr:capsular biosynthesis protein [Eubacterium sp.]
EEGVEVKLFLGNELYYEPELIGAVESGEFTTLNQGSHFLVETMRHDSNVAHVQDFLYRLHAKGYATILAHPERYDFIQQDPNLAIDFIRKGTLIQVNALSLIGFYGSRAKETAEIMLSHNMVQFLSSDAHRVKSYELMPRALERAEALIGAKRLKALTWTNPSIVLSGRGTVQTDPQTYASKSEKKGIFAALMGDKRKKKRRKDGIF